MSSDPKTIILTLLALGVERIPAIEQATDPLGRSRAEQEALGFFTAANAILGAFPGLYADIAEHRDFVLLSAV